MSKSTSGSLRVAIESIPHNFGESHKKIQDIPASAQPRIEPDKVAGAAVLIVSCRENNMSIFIIQVEMVRVVFPKTATDWDVRSQQ